LTDARPRQRGCSRQFSIEAGSVSTKYELDLSLK
jgi:hypothetical protein